MISVIVPFYNELANLPKLLASIRRQLGIVRYIFVDNGSKDGSYEFMRDQNEVQNGTWYLVTETRGGKSFALRSGLTVAQDIGSKWSGCLDAVVYTFGKHLDMYQVFQKAFRSYESILLSRIMPEIG